jgi:nicotinate phosphoribosyltransferase
MTKTIVFSDSLTTDKAIEIQQRFKNRVRVSFGVGTHLTNDVGVKPLNMVIKLMAARLDGQWVPTVKLSDDKGKWTGDPDTINLARQVLRI